MWCLQESTCWMVNGRWITLQSGIDYLPLGAKLFFHIPSVSAYMMLYLNTNICLLQISYIAHADYTFGILTKGI